MATKKRENIQFVTEQLLAAASCMLNYQTKFASYFQATGGKCQLKFSTQIIRAHFEIVTILTTRWRSGAFLKISSLKNTIASHSR